jgi:hypothetical protein
MNKSQKHCTKNTNASTFKLSIINTMWASGTSATAGALSA